MDSRIEPGDHAYRTQTFDVLTALTELFYGIQLICKQCDSPELTSLNLFNVEPFWFSLVILHGYFSVTSDLIFNSLNDVEPFTQASSC